LRIVVALAAAAFLPVACAARYSGLATTSAPEELRHECGATAVEGVPFVAQRERDDCGAAALAMIFAYWQVPIGRADVHAACPSTDKGGIEAKRLRDLARENGLSAWLVHGELADLEHELARGRPVLVGLAQPWSDGTYPHYAVVVGICRESDRVVTIDPAHGWQKNTVAGFLDEWEPVGRPALIFARPSPTDGAPTTPVNSSEIAR
jgi:ABC-type bacteriocin/lantibiotic exporter with double-glycine peptidase domain